MSVIPAKAPCTWNHEWGPAPEQVATAWLWTCKNCGWQTTTPQEHHKPPVALCPFFSMAPPAPHERAADA